MGRHCVIVLCHWSVVGGLFCVVLCWFWRSLSFLDVTRKALVLRRSVLAVSVIHVPSDYCGAGRRCWVVRLLRSLFLFRFISWKGACDGFALVFWLVFLLPSRPSFCMLSQPLLRHRCLVGDVL